MILLILQFYITVITSQLWAQAFCLLISDQNLNRRNNKLQFNFPSELSLPDSILAFRASFDWFLSCSRSILSVRHWAEPQQPPIAPPEPIGRVSFPSPIPPSVDNVSTILKRLTVVLESLISIQDWFPLALVSFSVVQLIAKSDSNSTARIRLNA